MSFASLMRSSQRARWRWRASRAGRPGDGSLVAKQVTRWPSVSVRVSCAPGWARSFRATTRIPAGQSPRSSRPVISATHAPSRGCPPASIAGTQALSSTVSIAALRWARNPGNPTE